jgi:hypothetical protein
MSKCPNCQSDIKDDFGLVTCSHCGAQVLISIDGSSEVVPSAGQAVTNLENVLVSELQADDEVAEKSFSDDPPPIENLSADVASEDIPISSQPPPPSPLEEFAPTRPTPAPQHAAQERPTATTPDMTEVADFGNSSASLAREGSLRFNIFISGIDTVDIRQQVQDALTDERFLWDAEALVSKSHNGELKITDISAVKSSLIIQRLRPISIDIRWEQHAIHQ